MGSKNPRRYLPEIKTQGSDSNAGFKIEHSRRFRVGPGYPHEFSTCHIDFKGKQTFADPIWKYFLRLNPGYQRPMEGSTMDTHNGSRHVGRPGGITGSDGF